MRTSSPLRVHVALAVALMAAPVMMATARADGGPAHELAERFAAEAAKTERRAAERAAQQRQRQIEDELKRNEADMLARARAEALAREAAEREETNRRRAAELERQEAERRAEEQRRQAAARIAEEAERARLAEAAAARAAEERRLAAEKAEEERRLAAADAVRREAQERERQAEADRISEALRQARDARERRREAEEREARQLLEEAERQAALPPPPPSLPPAVSPEASPQPPEDATGPGRYAVLLVMQPGDRGIRRHNKAADPVLCTGQGCYISGGPASPATLMRQSKALGFGRTWGSRAGPCANALGCIFRDVEIESAGYLQPVDMRVIRHDRREAMTVVHGSRCDVVAGRLACRAPMRSADYVMWLVPERLANEIGPAALERAVAEGLTEPEHARVEQPIWR